MLGANGYTVGLSGKWHLGDSMTPQHGFSHWFAMPLGGSKYNDAEMIRDGVVEVQPGYVTDIITDDALQFIEANKSQPFYLSVHYNAPHTPFDGHPQDIVDSYDDWSIQDLSPRSGTSVGNSRFSDTSGKQRIVKGLLCGDHGDGFERRSHSGKT